MRNFVAESEQEKSYITRSITIKFERIEKSIRIIKIILIILWILALIICCYTLFSKQKGCFNDNCWERFK